MLLKQGFKANFVSDIKSLSLEEDESIVIEGYANTISKDRAGDVIPASTWRKPGALQNYKNNPIILAFHKHDNPIGKAIELEATDLGLRIKARISKAAGKVYDLIKDGILSTFSVGFMIKDASYDPATETYFINDVELTEVSVVSVPCNQDSTFILSKSLEDAESFKQQFITPKEAPASPEPTGSKKMDFKLEDLLGQVSQTVKDTMSAQVAAEKAAADAAAKAAADKAAAADAAKSAARDAAASLVAELESKLKEKDSVFAEAVKAHSSELAAMKEEIAQVVASRNTPAVRLNPVAAATRSKAMQKREEAEIDAVVMLSIIKNIPAAQMFNTEFGKRHYAEKVNTSSSIDVSSNSYETIFSMNLMRDIQAELVIAPLFEEITMTSANLTIPVNPASGTATWVDSTTYGNTTTSGNEISAVLTERTLKTFKLAAKTFLTEETQEDAIIAVLPILRAHLVESHAKAIDLAFLRGTGVNQPKGLIVQAAAIGAAATEVSTANMSVKVTAKMLLNARRKLGLYGINLADITLIVSRDAYWDLLLDDQWADVQQVGTDAVKLRGEVGNIYGMKVLVSDGFEAKALNKAFALIVYTKNFVVPRQRDVIVKTDFDVERDRRVFVATQRLNLEPLIEVSAGNGAGLVQVVYAAA